MRAPHTGGNNRYDLTVPHVTLLYRLVALEQDRRLIGVPLTVPTNEGRITTFSFLILTRRVMGTPLMLRTTND